jgi:NAD-reducing hydrogenase small subunit
MISPKIRLATASLGGCFGCHMSFLDIDERILEFFEHVELRRSPLTDIKNLDYCEVGLIEGGLCNSENVHVLREFRSKCKVLISLGACAINGGLPAQRNHIPLIDIFNEVYLTDPGFENGQIPNDPELPLPLNSVHPLHDVVHIDVFIPGCPPSADTIWAALQSVLEGKSGLIPSNLIHYD